MKQSIQSVERAFQILQAIHSSAGRVGVGDVARMTGLPMSTTSRIITTLEKLGALDRANGQLFIGKTITAMGQQLPWKTQLIEVATPILETLVGQTGEAVGLTEIVDNICCAFLQLPSSHHIQIRDWTGETFLLHTTSSGKVYLSMLGLDEVTAILGESLEAVASGTLTDPAELMAELPAIRCDGVGWTIDELEDGLTTIAAPILESSGQFCAGLYLSAPGYRVGARNSAEGQRLATLVLQAAQEISSKIGFRDVVEV